MSSESLKKISISELTPGMFVDSIAEQTGNLQVASRGKVTNKNVVASLKKRGVTAVIIDPSKQFVPEGEEPAAEQEAEQAPVATEPAEKKKKRKVSFDK